MKHVRSTLLSRGVPAARIRYEVFGPDPWAAQTPSDSHYGNHGRRYRCRMGKDRDAGSDDRHEQE